ncbi:hypothetical protein EDD21DRAFT_388250 [Dissophora ornata]|nr:hypothetical protein EDD21DRAFT_388250 [Dissophora ornata]
MRTVTSSLFWGGPVLFFFARKLGFRSFPCVPPFTFPSLPFFYFIFFCLYNACNILILFYFSPQ